VPKLFDGRWRWFYSDQHGDNRLWEVLNVPRSSEQGDNEG
jgi:hypothetical protein